MSQHAIIEILVSATQRAYQDLESESREVGEVYDELTTLFATHGLDADTAESAVDWLEGGTLVESLEYALGRLRGENWLGQQPATPDHIHVWSSTGSGNCLVRGCNFICGLHDPDEWCHECGAQFTIDDNGIANHVRANTPDGIDHEADADHVPFSLGEDDS